MPRHCAQRSTKREYYWSLVLNRSLANQESVAIASDDDESGELDYQELANLAEALGSDLSPRQLEVALDVLDTDRSGSISFAEFSAWWNSDAGIGLV